MSIRHCLFNRCDFDDFSHVITCPPQISSLIHAIQSLKRSLSPINDAQYGKNLLKNTKDFLKKKTTDYVHIIDWIPGSNDPIKNIDDDLDFLLISSKMLKWSINTVYFFFSLSSFPIFWINGFFYCLCK